ncbi:MAG: B12-binding domain-containing radical SAM protein, partial [Clostridia bacterium]|nr:B12-binding domain-containing radical SAM protein [Clostridia bacterium]
YLRGLLREIKGVNFSWHCAETSVIEAALARGDRRQSALLIRAYELGAKFDAWTESFRWDIWQQAFKDCGLTVTEYIRERGVDEALPWDFIDTGVSKKYLLKERNLGYEGVTTKNCRDGCNACGANRSVRCSI